MFITDLWEVQPGKYFFLSTKSASGRWLDHPIKKGHWRKLKTLIRENPDKDIYMCPHGFDQPERLKDHSVDPHLLYSDLDEADPNLVGIRPTVAIESSPGRYVGYWFADGPCSEELNRRLAYTLGGDVSGWDRTQVLRVPNTRNYKYSSTPRVKILWMDGPTYTVEQLERMLPEVTASKVNQSVDEEAREIFEKYEKHLSRYARDKLMTDPEKVTPGGRSEVLFKLQAHCLEAGMTRDEAFAVIWVSPWNKFADRRNGPEQLWKELDKHLDRKMSSRGKRTAADQVDPEKATSERTWVPAPKPMSEIESENITWIIPSMFARREITIVEGDPGLGKSYFVQIVAGMICEGDTLPCVKDYPSVKGNVLYCDTENTASTVTKNRLSDNEVIEGQRRFYQVEEAFSVDDETRWDLVIARCEELRPTMIVFDTVNTYIGGADTYRSSETTQALAFFKELAQRFNCSVVLLRHLTKGGKDKAIYRGQGSIAFAGAARVVIGITEMPDEEGLRAVYCVKNNIAQHFKTFTYSIQGLPDTLKRTNRSVLVWGSEVDLTAAELMSAGGSEDKEKQKPKDKALEWLKDQLESGPKKARDLRRMADARSISKGALDRAMSSLEGKKDTVDEDGRNVIYWSLP